MITLKEYAESRGISYEAVRKQVARYRDDLEEHITHEGKRQYLDDTAIKFLDGKRAVNAVHIIEHDKDSQIEELKQQVETLRAEVFQLQDKIIKRDELIMKRDAEVIELQKELREISMKETTAAVPDPVPEEKQPEESKAAAVEHEAEAVPEVLPEEKEPSEHVPEVTQVPETEKERVNIDTLPETVSRDDTAHERESVADPVGAAADLEEKTGEKEVNEGESVPDREPELQKMNIQKFASEPEEKKGLLHKLFSFWKH